MIGVFILSDIILKKNKIEGIYYFNHFIANMIVVYNTFHFVIKAYDDSNYEDDYQFILQAKYIVYSLHIYHIIWYYEKLRYMDWLHHFLMVGITLPLTELIPNNNLIGHCLFFVNGLPGGIDYLLLLLVRNNIIDKMLEKTLNTYINLWIRCPGCISNVTLSIYNMIKYNVVLTNISHIASIIIIILVYWNGIYFMNQVVIDHTLTQYTKKIEKK